MPSTHGTFFSSGAAPSASDRETPAAPTWFPVPNKPRALLQKHAKAALAHRAGSRPRGNALRYLDRVAKGIAERLFALTGANAAGAIEFSADYRLVREKHPSSTSTSSKTLPWRPAKLFGRNCAAITRP